MNEPNRKILYLDVSAKLSVEASPDYDSNNLDGDLIILNKGDANNFEVVSCLIDNVSPIEPVAFFNLKEAFEDVGKATENKYCGLTKEGAQDIKNNLKNLKKTLDGGGCTSVSANHILNKVLHTLEQL